MLHLFDNALVDVIYSGVSGQCSYAIHYIITRRYITLSA